VTQFRKKIKVIIYLLATFLALTGSSILLSKFVNNAHVKDIVTNFGIFGPIFIVLGIVIGGVFVPMTHLPFTMGSLAGPP